MNIIIINIKTNLAIEQLADVLSFMTIKISIKNNKQKSFTLSQNDFYSILLMGSIDFPEYLSNCIIL